MVNLILVFAAQGKAIERFDRRQNIWGEGMNRIEDRFFEPIDKNSRTGPAFSFPGFLRSAFLRSP